jgi:hypothetical protein
MYIYVDKSDNFGHCLSKGKKCWRSSLRQSDFPQRGPREAEGGNRREQQAVLLHPEEDL